MMKTITTPRHVMSSETKALPTALVTGAAGFIGSHMVEWLLGHGYSVRAVDLPSARTRQVLGRHAQDPRLSIVEQDILSLDVADELFAGLGPIFNCAGMSDYRQAARDPEGCMMLNVTLPVRLLEVARRRRTGKVVLLSSASVYGGATGRIAEDRETMPVNTYGFSKLMAEKTAVHWYQVFDIPSIVLRVFGVYGPRAPADGVVIGTFLGLRRDSKPFPIVGDGTAGRDFIYITDVAEAALIAAESDSSGEIFNVGTGVPETLNRIAELLGGEVDYQSASHQSSDERFADIRKIGDRLGWAPRVSIEGGIRRTLDAEPVAVAKDAVDS